MKIILYGDGGRVFAKSKAESGNVIRARLVTSSVAFTTINAKGKETIHSINNTDPFEVFITLDDNEEDIGA